MHKEELELCSLLEKNYNMFLYAMQNDNELTEKKMQAHVSFVPS